MQPFTFFISYRREDTAPIALLLKYEIEKRLQFVRASVDVEDIRRGEQFPDRIRELINRAHVTIVLVGKNWMPRREQISGSVVQSKMKVADREKDWVLEEIEYSMSAPLGYDKHNRYKLKKRIVLPIFVDCEVRFSQFVVPKEIGTLSTVNAESIKYAYWPSSIGPMLDRLAMMLGLKKRPDGDAYPAPDAAKARTQPVGDEELATILNYEDYDGWYLDNFGNAEVGYLVKTFRFPHFNQAADFMRVVSDHCRVLNHHPEWRNVFDQVTVSLTTWDARRRVTVYDLNLALFMNKVAQAVLPRVT
jgi:pterin-4a-carbinolamine dehydratase